MSSRFTPPLSRRGALKCMAWAGTGVLWTVSGGIPRSFGLEGSAYAASAASFSFVQISDSHIGFNKEANPDVVATLREAIARINAMPVPPAFVIHTGDITHLSKPAQFDLAAEVLKEIKAPVHYVPGEQDFLDGDAGGYLARYGQGTKGKGWYSFDHSGVHFLALVNVVDLKPGGLGALGDEQLAWIEDDVAHLSSETPIVVMAHIPLWPAYAEWGWGTDDAARALTALKRFGSVTVLNGHIHQVMQKIEGNLTFHTALATAYPIPAPGAAPAPGPLKVPPEELRQRIGLTTVSVTAGSGPLALTDSTLATTS